MRGLPLDRQEETLLSEGEEDKAGGDEEIATPDG